MNLKQSLERERAKVPANVKRSGQWSKTRAAYLKDNDVCTVCGGTKVLEVHHIRPFHLHPDLELDRNNFITLCESNEFGHDCHLGFGHLGNFRSFNVTVRDDAKIWNAKIKNRPKE
jgi:hypothetical protein